MPSGEPETPASGSATQSTGPPPLSQSFLYTPPPPPPNSVMRYPQQSYFTPTAKVGPSSSNGVPNPASTPGPGPQPQDAPPNDNGKRAYPFEETLTVGGNGGDGPRKRSPRHCSKCGSADCKGKGGRSFCSNACRDCGKMDCMGRTNRRNMCQNRNWS